MLASSHPVAAALAVASNCSLFAAVNLHSAAVAPIPGNPGCSPPVELHSSDEDCAGAVECASIDAKGFQHEMSSHLSSVDESGRQLSWLGAAWKLHVRLVASLRCAEPAANVRFGLSLGPARQWLVSERRVSGWLFVLRSRCESVSREREAGIHFRRRPKRFDLPARHR